MARLLFGAWDLPGVCDVAAMTDALVGHLRRHDTYHSWFDHRPDGELRRHTIAEPALIDIEPVEYGPMTTEELREHLLTSTPDASQWGCFTFGVVQRSDHFTVYMSVDHLVTDGMSAGVIFAEVHLGYAALLAGSAPTFGAPASYTDFCLRERAHVESLNADSPQVREWIDVARHHGGTMPGFPLPLGDPDVPDRGAMVSVPLLDEHQVARFDAACADAGVRFSGGVFACAALAERELTGAETYCGLTPYDMRSEPAEFMSAGWYATIMPVTVPVGGASFAAAAQAAQASFDAGKDLAAVPFARVVELAADRFPGLHLPRRALPLVSIIDARKIPLTDQWDALNVGIYGDSRLSDQVCMWINRFAHETTLTISFPDNPIARDSVHRYTEALKRVYSTISEPVRLSA